MTQQLRIRPRLENISWSLYWKEAMTVDTECLETVDLELGEGGGLGTLSGQELLERAAKTLKWQPTSELQRLDNFSEPWERLLFRGRELVKDQTLESAGVQAGDTVVIVRRVLSADGWKVAMAEDFLDSEDEA